MVPSAFCRNVGRLPPSQVYRQPTSCSTVLWLLMPWGTCTRRVSRTEISSPKTSSSMKWVCEIEEDDLTGGVANQKYGRVVLAERRTFDASESFERVPKTAPKANLLSSPFPLAATAPSIKGLFCTIGSMALYLRSTLHDRQPRHAATQNSSIQWFTPLPPRVLTHSLTYLFTHPLIHPVSPYLQGICE